MAIEISGMRELSKKLSAIAQETDPKLVGQALRAAMTPMLNEARANAPTGKEAHKTYKGRLVAPGFLKRNIKLKKLRGRDKARIAYGIWAEGEAWYGQLVEAGTKRIRANPWLGRAYNSQKDAVVDDFKREISNRIIRKAQQIRTRG